MYGADGLETLRWCHVNDHDLVTSREIHDIVDRPFALTVPQHQTVLGRVGHSAVLTRVIVETASAVRGGDLERWPCADIVPAVVLHAVHENVRVRFVGQVSLDGLVGTVGVADEDLEALVDHGVDAAPHLGRKPSNLPGTSDEDFCHER